ncbi:hypothetical protein [Sphingomonas sp. MS122]|uniref:hypothetical protein n=1 Tax=Sphingomonas sp. MS122 TaxID=3412683 RepID=UPI003C30B687
MADLEVREWIAYGMLATLFAGAAAAALVYRHKAHWRRLRMAGSARAKRRELQRRR